MPKSSISTPNISDTAVQKRTGKLWRDWFSILDSGGAREMSHREIVALVGRTLEVGSWWQQMITVEYERSRGLRKKHERPGGFEISASRTIAAPMTKVYRAWTDRKTRERWLGKSALTIRKATPMRSLRVTWSDGTTSVDVGFYPKEKNRCVVAVGHSKLPNARAATRMKGYWSKALDALQSTVAR